MKTTVVKYIRWSLPLHISAYLTFLGMWSLPNVTNGALAWVGVWHPCPMLAVAGIFFMGLGFASNLKHKCHECQLKDRDYEFLQQQFARAEVSTALIEKDK